MLDNEQQELTNKVRELDEGRKRLESQEESEEKMQQDAELKAEAERIEEKRKELTHSANEAKFRELLHSPAHASPEHCLSADGGAVERFTVAVENPMAREDSPTRVPRHLLGCTMLRSSRESINRTHLSCHSQGLQHENE